VLVGLVDDLKFDRRQRRLQPGLYLLCNTHRCVGSL
jgi:hypothetical protein